MSLRFREMVMILLSFWSRKKLSDKELTSGMPTTDFLKFLGRKPTPFFPSMQYLMGTLHYKET